MAHIRVNVKYTIKDGTEIVFRSPVDCSEITGLRVYYPGGDGNTTPKDFALADAHGNNVGDIDHLFAENVVVKVILDVTSGMAFVQNADTNAYIESTFVKTINGVAPDENGNVMVSGEDSGPAIVSTASGHPIELQDASGQYIRGLSVFGKTAQNGTPTPAAPVELASAGQGGSIITTICGKNLARPRSTKTETIGGVTATFEADGVLLINGATTVDYNNVYYTNYLNSHGKRITLPAGTYTFNPELISGSLTNASYLLAYTGKSAASATIKTITAATTLAFTEETTVSFIVQFRTGGTADNARIRFQIEAGEMATAYEPYVEQTISVPTPDGLPGIPVDGGWIADEIDPGRGVYVQRVNKVVLTGAESWLSANTINGVNILYLQPIFPLAAAEAGLCTHFPYDQKKAYAGQEGYIGAEVSNVTGKSRIWVSTTMTAAEFKSFLAEHPVTVMYPMAEPVETALDADLLNEFAKLHSYKPNTTVTNDAGADMKLEYVADTKTYVDNHGGNGGNSGQIPTVEPAENDIPKVFITGVKPTTKDDVLAEMQYISKTGRFHAYLTIKCQGTSSMSYPKKNFTVKLYSDEARATKLKKDFKNWNHTGNKFVLKANYIDHSHSRNIVSARLWAEMVASRPDYYFLPAEMRNAPNNGAVDGFPIKVYYNGNYEGVYTWNIGKDDWMWGMDEDNANHVLLCAEGNTNGVYAETSSNFRALWDGVDGSKPGWSVEVGTNSAALKTSLNNLIQFVMDNDGDAFRNGIGQYLDTQSAIDYYILQYEICGLDGLAHNMLLATYDGVKWICGAYDLDATFGLWWDGTKFISATYRCPEDYQEQFSLLWERIEANFRNELKARQAELRKSVLSYANVITHFERAMDIIGLDLYAEDLTIYPGIPSGSTNNIKQLRNYIRDRQAYVDAEFAAMTGPVSCTGISLSATELTFTEIGTQTLTATVTPDDCTDTIVWTSSDESIAKVSNGVVSAIGNGNATITATCGAYSASCAVSVSGIVSVEYDTAYSLTQETAFASANETYIDTGVQLLDTNKDFTVFLKFRGSKSNLSASNNHAVLHCANEQSPWPGCGLQISQEKYRTFFFSGNQDTVPYNDTDIHTWILRKTAGSMNVTLTFDGTDYTLAGGSYSAVTQNLLIGCYQKTDGTKGRFWNGTVYECHVWNRVLTDGEVAVLSA